METEQDQLNKYIVFSIDNQRLAFPLMEAKEVIENQEVRPIPRSKKYFSGITNVRGEVIPVINLREKFFIEGKFDRSVFIIFELNGHSIAAEVDELLRVDQVEPDDISPIESVNSFLDKEYMNGVYKKGTDLITIVNLKTFLSNTSVKELSEAC